MTERLACLRLPDPSPAISERAALEDLARFFSPRVQSRAGGEVCLDLGRRLKSGQVLHAAGRAGLRPCLGVASGLTLAWLACRLAPAGRSLEVEPGQESRFLAPLPLDLLDGSEWLDETLRAGLRRFGVETLGQLAALPDRGLKRRLGQAGIRLWRLARGECRESFVGQAPVASSFEELALDWAVERLPALRACWMPVLERLVARLDGRGFKARTLVLSLGLADGGQDRRLIVFAQACCRADLWSELMERELERRAPAGAVEALRVEAQTELVRVAQGELFVPGPRPGRRLDETLGALRALVGARPLGSVRPRDSHHPDAFEVRAFAPGLGEPEPAEPEAASVPLLALRPAWPVRVRLDARSRRPLQIAGEKISGRIRRSVGPFRLDADWWTAAPLRRDTYEVELDCGILLRLYREEGTARWWIDGILG